LGTLPLLIFVICRTGSSNNFLTFCSEVHQARSRKTGAVVALKKILMHNEKDGVRHTGHTRSSRTNFCSVPHNSSARNQAIEALGPHQYIEIGRNGRGAFSKKQCDNLEIFLIQSLTVMQVISANEQSCTWLRHTWTMISPGCWRTLE
jgi:hypothetical protein